LYCWGWNYYGQLGNNSTTNSTVPVPVTELSTAVTAIALGGNFTCALVGGAAVCWGSDTYGRLGSNAVGDSLVPVDVLFP
jgi:alpha-tubulin suppressor-like RCC1 family protein